MTIRPALRVVTDAASLKALLDIAQEAENRQFSGLYVPSSGTTYKEFCRAALEATGSIIVSTSIVPIYRQPAVELASFAAELHDLSGGRFRLGLGVSHAAVLPTEHHISSGIGCYAPPTSQSAALQTEL